MRFAGLIARRGRRRLRFDCRRFVDRDLEDRLRGRWCNLHRWFDGDFGFRESLFRCGGDVRATAAAHGWSGDLWWGRCHR